MTNEIEIYAKKIWDFMRINDVLQKSDAILMLGSHDSSVTDYAINLYLNGLAPLLIFSGGRGAGTEHWDETEAEKYSKMARKKGVPEKDLLIENKSSNTAENIEFTKNLLKDKNIHLNRIILVQKPFMGRRVQATMQKMWNNTEYFITSPQITFEDYSIPGLSREEMISSMTGDFERLILYGKKDFSTPQTIPDDVWEARNKIRDAGIMRRYIEV